MKTQIGIISGGSSGLLLSQLLNAHSIGSIVLERQSDEYVLVRIRASLLESCAIGVLKRAGAVDNLAMSGIEHEGVMLVCQGEMFRIDFQESTGDSMTIFWQTELTRDLYEEYKSSGRQIIHGGENVELVDVAAELQIGSSIEKSIAPLRSFVCEPMRWGRSFCLAMLHILCRQQALDCFYRTQDASVLDDCSEKALRCVWKFSRFSWSLTNLLRGFYEGNSAFGNKISLDEFDCLATSTSAHRLFA